MTDTTNRAAPGQRMVLVAYQDGQLIGTVEYVQATSQNVEVFVRAAASPASDFHAILTHLFTLLPPPPTKGVVAVPPSPIPKRNLN